MDPLEALRDHGLDAEQLRSLGRPVAARSSYRYIEMLTTAAVIYWLLSIGLELIQNRLERHYGKGFKQQR